MSRVSRRALLTSGAAAGVLAASGLPLRADPKRGGVLRAGLSGGHAADGWDARGHAGLFMAAAAQGAVFDCLTEVAADGALEGELATAWHATEAARVWTFDLRRGVRFHDGTPFTARDVLASYALHRGTASPAGPIMAGIAAMAAPDDHTVRFDLHAPNADFPYLLSDYHLVIYPADAMARAMAHGIGTGLYRVERFEPGRRLQARRVETHYKDGRAGWFDALDLHALPDAAARDRALAEGRIDVADGLTPRQAARLGRTHRVTPVAGNMFYGFGMRADAAPFDSPAVRRALKHAIDRPAILRKVLDGRGQIAADTPIGPAAPYHDAAPPPDYDPDRARALLRAAGLDGLRLRLATSDDAFEGAVEAAWLYRDAARAAGIDIAVHEEPADGAPRRLSAARPFAATRWWGRATEDWMLGAAFAPDAAWNDTGWTGSAAYQCDLAEARATLDPARRQTLYARAQAHLRDEGSLIVPVFADFVQATATRIATPARQGALWPMDNARMAERWWMA